MRIELTPANRQTAIILAGIAAFVLVAFAGVTFAVRQSGNLLSGGYEYAITDKLISVSPTGLGDATFSAEKGFLDTVIYLKIHDYTSPYSKAIDVPLAGNMSGQGIWPKKMYWSGDGTIFVLADQQYIYDFKRHSDALPAEYLTVALDSKNGWPNGFKAFLAGRGGKGKDIVPEST